MTDVWSPAVTHARFENAPAILHNSGHHTRRQLTGPSNREFAYLTLQHLYPLICELIQSKSCLNLVDAVHHIGSHIYSIKPTGWHTTHLYQRIHHTGQDLRQKNTTQLTLNSHTFFNKWVLWKRLWYPIPVLKIVTRYMYFYLSNVLFPPYFSAASRKFCTENFEPHLGHSVEV